MRTSGHEERPGFPLIDIAGAPFERGQQYGERAVQFIEKSISIYRSVFADAGHDWPVVRKIAAQFASRIEAYSIEMLEEIRGIATGAGLPIEDIIALNARTELTYGRDRSPIKQPLKTDGCTGAIALPEITADGHVIHGQNWDWRDECRDSTIVLRVHPDKGPSVLTMVEAGTLARCGFNSNGVAITGNFLKCQYDDGRDGVPVPLVRRSILGADNLADAMVELLRAPRSFSNNLMISDAIGHAIDFETTPKACYWVAAEQGLLVHANHFVSPGALSSLTDLGLLVTPDSLYREQRVRAYLSERAGRGLTPADFANAFADKVGAPNAVCRNPVYGPGGDFVSTVATVIMDVTARRLWIARTPYEGVQFWEYGFDMQEPEARTFT